MMTTYDFLLNVDILVADIHKWKTLLKNCRYNERQKIVLRQHLKDAVKAYNTFVGK